MSHDSRTIAEPDILATVISGLEAVRVTIGSVQTRVDSLTKQLDTQQSELNRTRDTVQNAEIQLALLDNDLRKLNEIFTSLYSVVVVGDKQPSLTARIQALESDQEHTAQDLDDVLDNRARTLENSRSFRREMFLAVLGAIIAGILGFFGGIFAQ